MAIKKVTVLAFEPLVKATSQAGKPYDAYRILYRDHATNKVDEWVKPAASLKFNQALSAKLHKLTPNDEVSLVIDKNDKGFLDLLDVVTDGDPVQIQQSQAASASTQRRDAPSAPTGKGSYETSEERAAKQVYIIRQSSISAAVAAGNTSVDNIINVAKQLTEFVLTGEVPKPTTGKKSIGTSKTKTEEAPPFEDDDIPDFGMGE